MKIHLDEIKIENPNIEPGELDSLMSSMKDKGLLHAITLVKDGNKYEIVAGRKRYLAAVNLAWKTIDAKIIEGDSDALTEIHIHENLMRQNLTWYEQAELVTKLHALRQQQHGAAPKQGGRGCSGWSLRDTAKELNMSLGATQESTLLAQAIHNDPTLAKIKDRDTALRVVRASIKRHEAEATSNENIDEDTNVVYCGNSLDLLARMPAGFVHACVTDPPWLEFHGEKEYESDEDTIKVFEQIYRVLRPDSFLYAFVGVDDFYSYKNNLPKYGFQVMKTPLLWLKENIVSMGKRAWEYDRDFEFILVAAKGSPVLINSGKSTSIHRYTAIPGQFLKHPNEKVVALCKKLIEDCTYEGAIVLDPFAGSGAILRAAKETGRRFIGVEREHKHYLTCLESVQSLNG